MSEDDGHMASHPIDFFYVPYSANTKTLKTGLIRSGGLQNSKLNERLAMTKRSRKNCRDGWLLRNHALEGAKSQQHNENAAFQPGFPVDPATRASLVEIKHPKGFS